MICHAGEQVSLCLIALRKRHAVGLGEFVQEIAALQVLIAEELITAHCWAPNKPKCNEISRFCSQKCKKILLGFQKDAILPQTDKNNH